MRPVSGSTIFCSWCGITLPTGFTLEDLENRDSLLKAFDDHFRTLDKSSELSEGLDTFHKQALEILRSDKTKKAFNLNQETPATREAYGSTPAGLGLMAARRLVQPVYVLGHQALHTAGVFQLAQRKMGVVRLRTAEASPAGAPDECIAQNSAGQTGDPAADQRKCR